MPFSPARILASFALLAALSSPVCAQPSESINYDEIADGGFADVANILREMTPAQRKEVLAQAEAKAQEMQTMSPQEQEALHQQLRLVGNTIKMDQIDPTKLNVSKSKDLAGIQKDLNTYQTKYDAGKISNSAVKTHAESQ